MKEDLMVGLFIFAIVFFIGWFITEDYLWFYNSVIGKVVALFTAFVSVMAVCHDTNTGIE